MTNSAAIQNMPEPEMADRYRGFTGRGNVSSRSTANRHHELYTRWITELWAGRGNAAELVSPDFVGHWPTREVHGPEELQTVIDNTRGQLKELLFVVDVGPFCDGDMVAARWVATGSSSTGPARFTGNDILRIADGKIVEHWTGMSPA